jgi:hypothetical protein
MHPGARCPISTRVNKPENDDPSMVEPMLADPKMKARIADFGYTAFARLRERLPRGFEAQPNQGTAPAAPRIVDLHIPSLPYDRY